MIRLNGNLFKVLEVGAGLGWLELQCITDTTVQGTEHYEKGGIFTYFINDTDIIGNV